jgi:hypothetical protein
MTRLLMLSCVLGVGISACVPVVPVGPEVGVDVYPPGAFIATASPVYFEGRAAYWYGNRWWYRDGGAWRFYGNEPAYLRSYRARVPAPARQYYGRAHGGGYRRR